MSGVHRHPRLAGCLLQTLRTGETSPYVRLVHYMSNRPRYHEAASWTIVDVAIAMTGTCDDRGREGARHEPRRTTSVNGR